MTIDIRTMQFAEAPMWDAYVQSHPNANLYHLSAWQSIIQDTYKHKPYYLMAVKRTTKLNKVIDAIVGVLPLVHLKSFLFGNQLISIPFFDMGGILADDEFTEQALLVQAMSIGQRIGAKTLELRNTRDLEVVNSEFSALGGMKKLKRCCDFSPHTTNNHPRAPQVLERSNKVRMILELPSSSAELMRSFKSKLRSQIQKPIKEGLKPKIGGAELIDDFYRIFLVNMRDLGSPVHSKDIFQNVVAEFSDTARIIIVYMENQPVAGSLVIGFKEILENPWASSLRQHRKLSPNMLLYWTMLEYACENGYKYFDFGRSTRGEGTYKFKEQWGAKPEPLNWFYLSFDGTSNGKGISEDAKFQLASEVWKRLPVPVTKVVGPRIRKYISL